MTDVVAELARLKRWLKSPDKVHIRDILERRIYALEREIVFTNPFNEVDEVLYQMSRSY